MNNDREVLEALLAGKVLISKDRYHEIKLVDGNIAILNCPNKLCLGIQLSETVGHCLNIQKGYWAIKQETILINGIEVPTPEKVSLGKVRHTIYRNTHLHISVGIV